MDWLSWVAGIGGRAPVRPDKPRDPMAQLVALLHHHAIDLVLDVDRARKRISLSARDVGDA